LAPHAVFDVFECILDGTLMDRSWSAAKRAREDGDVRRYRRAAEDTLQQLDWCIGYLHGIRKTKVAHALARNRSFIRSQLMRQPAERLPSERSDASPAATNRRASSPS
jgi:hypothetical protein